MDPIPIPPGLDAFEALVRRRRATRHFTSAPVDPLLVDRLLEIAQWAPSGYNLQPTRFVVVTDRALRPALRRACMDQAQIEEAPVLVVFAGDHDAAALFERTLALDLAAGATTPEYVALLRRLVPLAFRRGPLGLNRLWKTALLPVVRWVRPVPNLPAVDGRAWLAKQTMLAAMTFLLAAESAGLGSLPMEGFDTARVRRALAMPRSWEPMLVVAIGRARPPAARKSRLPLDEVLLRRE